MTIKELISVYVDKGHTLNNAKNLAAQEILLKKIASSNMVDCITLKGGIVMYNLSKNDRRVTQDIDFDLMRYSIDDDSIILFIQKMNNINDGFEISLNKKPEKLHQEEYKGVRLHTIIKDEQGSSLTIKLDIGVHTYSAIEQEKIMFSFESNGPGITIKVNPPEQIFIEKLISLARLGSISTRYKDLYDLYYLIQNCNLSKEKCSEYLNLILGNSKKSPHTLFDFKISIEDTLNNSSFLKEASAPASKWIDVSIEEIKESILFFMENFY